jgi:hypothetical protein
MNKKEHKILIWILVCATTLLIILYSPIGSPDLYGKKSYFAENQGVIFSGRITNAPNGSKGGLQNSNNLELPKNILSENSGSELGNGTGIESEKLEGALPIATMQRKKYSVRAPGAVKSFLNNSGALPAYKGASTMPEQTHGSANGGGGGGGSMPTFGSSRNSNNNNNNNSAPNIGLIAMSLDLSLFSDSTSTRQAVDYSANQGGTDPGGNPVETPIPVPDGFWFLLFLAIGYIGFKVIRK